MGNSIVKANDNNPQNEGGIVCYSSNDFQLYNGIEIDMASNFAWDGRFDYSEFASGNPFEDDDYYYSGFSVRMAESTVKIQPTIKVGYFHISSELDGYQIVEINGSVDVPSTTLPDPVPVSVNFYNLDDDEDILISPIIIADGQHSSYEIGGSGGIVITGKDMLHEGDTYRMDPCADCAGNAYGYVVHAKLRKLKEN